MPYADPIKYREYQERVQKENHTKYAVAKRAWMAAHKEEAREQNVNSYLKRAYGLSRAEYDAKLKEQGGVCAICRKMNGNKRYKRLTVDHDHVTGQVRGLLCHLCNSGLGSFRDDAVSLHAAITYLQQHKRVSPVNS